MRPAVCTLCWTTVRLASQRYGRSTSGPGAQGVWEIVFRALLSRTAQASRRVRPLLLMPLVLALSPVAVAGAGPAAAATSGHIAWSPCPKVSGYLCGTLAVPLDYRHPSEGSVPLAVMEHPVAQSKGVIVFNPGGPGESGVLILPILASLVPAAVKDQFTLVSFDERGTGSSEPLALRTVGRRGRQRRGGDGRGHPDVRRPGALLSGQVPGAVPDGEHHDVGP